MGGISVAICLLERKDNDYQPSDPCFSFPNTPFVQAAKATRMNGHRDMTTFLANSTPSSHTNRVLRFAKWVISRPNLCSRKDSKLNCLVVEPTPLKNMGSSVGIMKFPIYGKLFIHVPNHQPATVPEKSASTTNGPEELFMFVRIGFHQLAVGQHHFHLHLGNQNRHGQNM